MKEQFEPEAYRIWSSFKQSQEAATRLLLRFHADEIVSHPSARVTSNSQNKTFEALLLEEVKPIPPCRNWKEANLWKSRSNNIKRCK